MWFLDNIIDYLATITDWFYDAYQEVGGWQWPFYYLSTPLYGLYRGFRGLTHYFDDFNDWVSWAAGKIGTILSTWDISTYFRAIFDAALDAWEWVKDALRNTVDIIDLWWQVAKYRIWAWIAEAKLLLQAQIDSFTTWLANLQDEVDSLWARIPSIDAIVSWFSNWWGNILVNLDAWWTKKLIDIQGLIESTIKIWFPFYESLAQLWKGIEEFFTDPEDWLYKSLDRIVERFW